MQRDLKINLGKQLRKEFQVPDDLPFPMRKALEALTEAPAYTAHDNAESRDAPNNTNPPLAHTGD
jgi:hypothetical protein